MESTSIIAFVRCNTWTSSAFLCGELPNVRQSLTSHNCILAHLASFLAYQKARSFLWYSIDESLCFLCCSIGDASVRYTKRRTKLVFPDCGSPKTSKPSISDGNGGGSWGGGGGIRPLDVDATMRTRRDGRTATFQSTAVDCFVSFPTFGPSLSRNGTPINSGGRVRGRR